MFFKKDNFTIRELSSLIGTLTSTFPGNKFGSLYYRELDKCKTLGLKKAKGNFDTLIKLTKEAILDLQWWIKNLYTVSNKLQYPDITKLAYIDASMHGCGAYCEGMPTGGSWINTEKNWHIKALELKSILLSLVSIFKDHRIQVKVFSDSTIAIACISKLSTSHSELCHHITKQIWEWAEKKHTYFSCPYTKS